MRSTQIEELERTLKALGNRNRLKLLISLQEAKGYRDLDLQPTRDDDLGSPDRAISRPALRRHLDPLIELGVVRKDEEGRAHRFQVDHARLFAVIEDLREIASVRPTEPVEGETMGLEAEQATREVDRPHLVLARGVQEGRVFELAPKGSDAEWVLGRDPNQDIPLDYDAYISSEHARILHREDGFFLADVRTNRNGTFLNWNKLARGGVAKLRSGDVIGVGRSLLVFRTGREE